MAHAVERALSVAPVLDLTITGDSMRPLICPGMRVRVRRPREGEVLLHRVVVAIHEDKPIAHRVIRETGTGDSATLVLRGDNNARRTETVARGQVIGVVVGSWLNMTLVGVERVPRVVRGILGRAWWASNRIRRRLVGRTTVQDRVTSRVPPAAVSRAAR